MDRDDASRGHIYEIAEKPLQQIFEDCKRRTTNKVSVYLKSIVAIGFVVAVEVPFACCVADVSQVEVHTFLTILGCHCSQSTALHTHQAHSFHVQFCVCVCVCVSLSLSLSYVSSGSLCCCAGLQMPALSTAFSRRNGTGFSETDNNNQPALKSTAHP
jgi:hypothetical protein